MGGEGRGGEEWENGKDPIALLSSVSPLLSIMAEEYTHKAPIAGGAIALGLVTLVESKNKNALFVKKISEI